MMAMALWLQKWKVYSSKTKIGTIILRLTVPELKLELLFYKFGSKTRTTV